MGQGFKLGARVHPDPWPTAIELSWLREQWTFRLRAAVWETSGHCARVLLLVLVAESPKSNRWLFS